MISDVMITGVAILDEQGRLWSLPAPKRHHHLMYLAAFMNDTTEGASRREGFTTNAGRFVDRKEALEIALASGQPMRNPDPSVQLYSEDLW